MPDPTRILLVRLSHLGDVVHALPVFHAARARWPGARIGWVVQPEFRELVAGLPGLERTFSFGRRDGARAWWRLGRELRAFAPDLAIDCQGNVKSAVATRLSGAPRRAGLHPRDWREPIGARVLTETARPVGDVGTSAARPTADGPHALERQIALARHIAGDPGLEPRLDPALTDVERAHGRELCRRWLPPGPTPAILQLGSPRDVRTWPRIRAGELARACAERGQPLLVLSGPAEADEGHALAAELGRRHGTPPGPAGADGGRALAPELGQPHDGPTGPAAPQPGSLPHVAHWVGQRGLRELAGFFAAAAERGARFVGADSGPLHLAAATGLAVVSLAGPQSHGRTGPWPPPECAGSPHAVVRAAVEPACAPCLSRKCHHPSGPVCMSDLAAERVLAALSPAR